MSLSRRTFVGGMSASLVACAAPRQSWSKMQADVIVIGAGLAGLQATYLIEQAGLKVLLLEGNSRIGGRLYTLDDLPGTPDAGGIQVGASYRRFHSIADRLDIEQYVPESTSSGWLYNIGDKTFLKKDWPASLQNNLSPIEKDISPDALFFHYLRKLPALENVTDWMSPGGKARDVALRQFMLEQGASEDALRLMEANLNGNRLSSQSTLHMQRSLAVFKAGAGATTFVRGGTQRMTDAMASSLKSEVMLNAKVTGIRDTGANIEISLNDGRLVQARQAICTAPFSTVRDMSIDAALPVDLRKLFNELPYTKASFAFLQAKTPFWKDDGLPHSIWSDHPLVGRVFALDGDPPMVKLWVNGSQAAQLDKMDPENAGQEMIKRVEKIRPSAKGQLSFMRMFSWQKQEFAKGVYHHIGTGQGQSLAAAARYKGERLHFAGEHLAQASTGMEGALETAEKAVRHVLNVS